MVGAHEVVVVDPWPLVRLGIGRALPAISYRVVAEASGASDGAAAIGRASPGLVLIGSHVGDGAESLVKAAKRSGARIVVMVQDVGREDLAALATAGADGILLGSSTAEEVADAAGRVMTGHRVLAPALVPALAGIVARQQGRHPLAEVLTERERQVLGCLVKGWPNDKIAAELFMSAATVKSHLSRIYAKLEVRNRQEAMARAVALGIEG